MTASLKNIFDQQLTTLFTELCDKANYRQESIKEKVKALWDTIKESSDSERESLLENFTSKVLSLKDKKLFKPKTTDARINLVFRIVCTHGFDGIVAKKQKEKCKVPSTWPVTSSQKEEERKFENAIQLKREDITSSNVSFRGIDNATGTDCFLIASLQMLQCPLLKQHVIEKLPHELRKYFLDGAINSGNFNSADFRKALILFAELGLNDTDATTKQYEATECLEKILDRVSKPDYEKRYYQTVLAPLAEERSSIEKGISNYISYKILSNIMKLIFSPLIGAELLLRYAINYLFPDPLNPPENYPKRGEALLKEQNPVLFTLEETFTYDLSAIDESIKADVRKDRDLAEGQTESKKATTTPIARLSTELNNVASFSLQDVFNQQFGEVHSLENTETKREIGGKKHSIGVTSCTKFKKAPSSLIIQMNRTFTSPSGCHKFFGEAIGDLKKLTISPTQVAEATGPFTLDLKSFIIHIGSSGNSGHYIACRKEGDSWYYFNDSRSEQITEEAALRLGKYALIYYYDHQP